MRTKLVVVIIISLFLFLENVIAQSDNTLTLEQVNQYSNQSKQLVNYLEGTLNFLGNPNELPSEKDVIINNSYLKFFASDKVQIEDDLDENREIPLNKDVQAYLKDIDFFYKNITFSFNVENIEQIVADSGIIVFKLTLNRHLTGVTVDNDTVDNNQLRYIEINLDPLQRDLKIASIYTTKVREKEEMRYWWNNMSSDWKTFFGKSILVYDTLPFGNIIWFSDSSIVTMKWSEIITSDTINLFDDTTTDPPLFAADSLLIVCDTIIVSKPDTINVSTSTIYRILNTFRKIKKLDISNNLILKDITPVSELTELVNINISNTLIEDLIPIRNLNKLETFNCSGTPVLSLEPLRYITILKEFDCSKTSIENINVLSNLRELSDLDLSNTKLLQLDALSELKVLAHLKLSGTKVSDLSPLNKLKLLSDLNLSNTQLQNLNSIDSLTSIQNLNIDSTNIVSLEPLSNYKKLSILQANNIAVSDLSPLTGNSSLKVIYCDNSSVSMNEANSFMDANPNCLVIYNSQELINWWEGLSENWKKVFTSNYNISVPVTKEKLHQLINQTSLVVTKNQNINSLEPIRMLHRLENLHLQNTNIVDLSPLAGLNNLENLNLNNTNIVSLVPLSSLQNLIQVSFENTEIDDLMPLSNSHGIEKIYCDESKITLEKALEFKKLHNSCLIVYQSQKLKLWWNNLSTDWQQVLSSQLSLPISPSNEELQQLVDLKELVISNNKAVDNLNPLHIFVRLRNLTINNTSITDLSPIKSLDRLKKLNLLGNPISELGSISEFTMLKELIIENTSVEDLEPISNLTSLVILNIAGTRVKSLKYIAYLTNLEKLYINNTRVKNLKPLATLSKLELLQCYNTLIKSSKIDDFRALNQKAEVIYY